MRLAVAAILLALAAPANAGTREVVEGQILPGYAAFAEATAALAAAAQGDCTAASLRAPYQAAFDAWMGVSHISIGPIEEDGRALAIAFWPDPRGFAESSLRRMIADEDPVAADPEKYGEVSVAARGLFALDFLLYDEGLSQYAAGSYSCTLAVAITADLAGMAAAIDAGWRTGFAEAVLTAGAAGNDRFRSPREASQALFTMLVTGLEFTKDQRIGRPLGTFDRPRPTRAEAWRSGRPQRNVVLLLEALRDLASRLLEDPPPDETLAAIDLASEAAEGLDDPVFAGVSERLGRNRLELLYQRIGRANSAAAKEIGPRLGVAAGFNALDGD